MQSYAFTESCIFFFNDTATTEIYTLSLHDALPISVGVARQRRHSRRPGARPPGVYRCERGRRVPLPRRALTCRSEEHTSELQSRPHLVCRLLLEKNKDRAPIPTTGDAAQRPYAALA